MAHYVLMFHRVSKQRAERYITWLWSEHRHALPTESLADWWNRADTILQERLARRGIESDGIPVNAISLDVDLVLERAEEYAEAIAERRALDAAERSIGAAITA